MSNVGTLQPFSEGNFIRIAELCGYIRNKGCHTRRDQPGGQTSAALDLIWCHYYTPVGSATNSNLGKQSKIDLSPLGEVQIQQLTRNGFIFRSNTAQGKTSHVRWPLPGLYSGKWDIIPVPTALINDKRSKLERSSPPPPPLRFFWSSNTT